MLVIVLFIFLFALVFTIFQTIAMYRLKTTPIKEAIKVVKRVEDSNFMQEFVARKQIILKRYGADVFVRDQITVSQWYTYKIFITGLVFLIVNFITRVALKSEYAIVFIILGILFSWFFLDVYLRLQNKASNEEMMADICEMSRSVLYGKRGGQYISDALKDAVMVVENKRLKTALIRLKSSLDAGRGLDECLSELELSFANGEIASFCTVIKSLQSTGQVDEALKTLENNIEREQIGVNKRRCIILENKTMMYVMLIAGDLLALIMYCIIMKLLELQIAF